MIRPATAEEAKATSRFFDRIDDGLGSIVLGDDDLWMVDRDGMTSVCAASPDLADLPPSILEGAVHIGLRIGTWEEEGFCLDLQGATRMAGHTRKQMIRVNEKATRLFLYSRAIFGDSVKTFDPRLNPGDVCVVCNLRWEALGLAMVTGRFKGRTPALESVHDLGTYLRDQE